MTHVHSRALSTPLYFDSGWNPKLHTHYPAIFDEFTGHEEEQVTRFDLT